MVLLKVSNLPPQLATLLTQLHNTETTVAATVHTLVLQADEHGRLLGAWHELLRRGAALDAAPGPPAS